MLPAPRASMRVNGPRTNPWVLPCRRRSAWKEVRTPWETRYSARAGGSAPGCFVRKSPITWSSWPRSMRLERRRSQTNHSQAPRSVDIMTSASSEVRGGARGRRRLASIPHEGSKVVAGIPPGAGRYPDGTATGRSPLSKHEIRKETCQTIDGPAEGSAPGRRSAVDGCLSFRAGRRSDGESRRWGEAFAEGCLAHPGHLCHGRQFLGFFKVLWLQADHVIASHLVALSTDVHLARQHAAGLGVNHV